MSQVELRERAPGQVVLSGDLDFSTVLGLLPQGLAQLSAHDAVLMDLSGVQRANSAGLALLLEWTQQARDQGVKLSFSGLPDSLRDIARLSNALDLLPLQSDTA